LETAAAARYCRMTILQNVSVVKSRGMSAILSGEANRLGASIRNSFRRFVPALPACTERCAGDGELVFHGRADSLVHFSELAFGWQQQN